MRHCYAFIGILLLVVSVHAQSVISVNNLPAIIAALKNSKPYTEVHAENKIVTAGLTVHRDERGPVCKSYIENKGSRPLTVNNIVLFEIDGQLLDPNNKIYGEGFQLLIQTTGTLGHPVYESYTDEGHCHIIGPHKMMTAARTSNDVSRNRGAFKTTAKEKLHHARQNGKLWYTDPDCFVIDANGDVGSELTENEFMFHPTVVHAAGGLVLLGDKYKSGSEKQFAIIKKQIHPTGKGTGFTDDSFKTGVTDLGKVQYYYFLNWDDNNPVTLKVQLKARATPENYWQGTSLGGQQGEYVAKDLPPRSGLNSKATDIK